MAHGLSHGVSHTNRRPWRWLIIVAIVLVAAILTMSLAWPRIETAIGRSVMGAYQREMQKSEQPREISN